MLKWRSADLTTGRWCATCLKLAREMERQSGKESFTSGRTCPDCVETIREAKLIQTSLLPTHAFRNESVDIAFRFIPLSDVGGDFVDFFRLPDGLIGIYLADVVGKGLSAAMVCRARDGNPARDSQVRNGYRAGSFPVERASGAATHQGPLLLDLVRSFQPCHAGTHLLQRLDATTPAGLRKRVPAAWRGWVTLGNVPGFHLRTARRAACPRRCVLFATDGLHELRNGEGVEFCSVHMEEAWAQCRHKSATESADFVFDRRVAFSDGSVPHNDISVVVLKVLR
jgi:serine phosphatase RsbU (regulator of sigma subunit)